MTARAKDRVTGVVTIDRAERGISLAVVDTRKARHRAATVYMSKSEARRLARTLARFAAGAVTLIVFALAGCTSEPPICAGTVEVTACEDASASIQLADGRRVACVTCFQRPDPSSPNGQRANDCLAPPTAASICVVSCDQCDPSTGGRP